MSHSPKGRSLGWTLKETQASAEGRRTKPSGQEGLADGALSKLRGPIRMEDASETVPIMVTAASAN